MANPDESVMTDEQAAKWLETAPSHPPSGYYWKRDFLMCRWELYPLQSDEQARFKRRPTPP